jgi:hypothetical protein
VKSRARSAAREWFESVTPLVEPFAQIDVDQLGEQHDWSPSNVLGWSVALFEALCSVALQARSSDVSMLVVPLAYSAALDCSDPGVDSIFASEWTELEVPGLYLIRDSGILGFDAPEEYRRTLSVSAPGGASKGYYRCWRTTASEFSRALYFVKLPPPLATK